MVNPSRFKSKLIEVVFRDGKKGRMAPKALDLFLKSNKILKFKRSSGWVTVGVHPLRGDGEDGIYPGPERRSP